MGNEQIRAVGKEKSISPILSASASTKISHDFASPEITTLLHPRKLNMWTLYQR